MRTIIAKYRRSPGRFLLLLLVTGAAMLFVMLAFQLYMLSVESARQVEENTVTIAITPTQVHKVETPVNMTEEEVYAYWRQKGPGGMELILRGEIVPGTEDVVNRAYVRESVFVHVPASEMGPGSSAILGEHDTRTLAGWFPGSATLAVPFKEKAYERQVITYDSTVSSTEATALMTVTITNKKRIQSVEVKQQGDGTPIAPYDVDGQAQYPRSTLYEFVAAVEEVHVLGEDLGTPKEIILRTFVSTETGAPLFKIGDTLTVFGQYIPDYDELPVLDQTALGPYAPETRAVYQESSRRWLHYQVQQEAYPLIMQPGDERFAVMEEAARFNSGLLFVTGIQRSECLPLFSLDEAYLTKGRDIQAEDLENGATVCLLNEQFALRNGLTVGDVIELSLYETDVQQVDGGVENRLQRYVYHQPYQDVAEPPVSTAAFTVVGLYHSPLWLKSEWAFTPNTVFVPVTALPAGEKTVVPYAESTLLHNGMGTQFRMDASGYEVVRDFLDADVPLPAPFTICDGDYEAFMDSLAAMRSDSGFVLLVCAILYAVLILSAASMMTRHLGSEATLMRRIGASKKQARAFVLGCTLPVAALSAGLAYAACALIQTPLLNYLETWYALSAPRYSNLPDTGGVMTAMGQGMPSPLGAALALIACTAVTLILTESTLRERRQQ